MNRKIKHSNLLPLLKERLGKEEFNLVMEINMTPLSELIYKSNQEQKRIDAINNKDNLETIRYFSKLKRKYILNPKISNITGEIISVLKKESTNAGNRQYQNNTRNMRRYVVGNKKEVGKS